MNATSLSSDMENLSLDDDEERSNKIRAELERINKTLELSVMEKNQPYTHLPYQYRPNWGIDHRPPVFLYGLGLTFAEIREYTVRANLPSLTSEGSTGLFYEFSEYLDELFGVEKGIVYGFFPTYRGPVIFRFKTNYHSELSREKIEEIVATCKHVFDRPPMWYVGSAQKTDYRISEPKFFLSVE